MDQQLILSRPRENDPEEAVEEFGTTVLDSDGDVTLVVKNEDGTPSQSFLVSSKALSLASPVFTKMFGPDFKEGNLLRNGDHPSIDLKEEYPEAMTVILLGLHYRFDDLPPDMEPSCLAKVAMQCDKYDCNAAFKPWLLHRYAKREKASTDLDLGYLLLAAYMLRSPDFSEITTQTIKKLTPDFISTFEKSELLSFIPASLISKRHRLRRARSFRN